MTTAQFIADIATRPNFIRWAETPQVIPSESIGDVEKWKGVAFLTTDDGSILKNVFFLVDTTNGQATWQGNDMIEQSKNIDQVKMTALTTYLKANFNAYFIGRVDLINNWAEADVYSLSTGKLAKKSVIVYQQGNNPIAHLDVI